MGNPAWIVLISCLYSGSALLALFRDSLVINLSLGGVSEEVKLMVASETAQTMSVVASITTNQGLAKINCANLINNSEILLSITEEISKKVLRTPSVHKPLFSQC